MTANIFEHTPRRPWTLPRGPWIVEHLGIAVKDSARKLHLGPRPEGCCVIVNGREVISFEERAWPINFLGLFRGACVYCPERF